MRVSLRCNLPLADGSEDSTDEELLRSLGHNGSGGRAFRLPNKALLQIDCGKTIWFIFFSTFLKFVITRSLTFCSSLLKICKLLSIISLLSHEILTYRCFGCSLWLESSQSVYVICRALLLLFIGKLQMLDSMLCRLVREKRRVVIFAQKSSVLDIISSFATWRGYHYIRLNVGSTVSFERYIYFQNYGSLRSNQVSKRSSSSLIRNVANLFVMINFLIVIRSKKTMWRLESLMPISGLSVFWLPPDWQPL